MTGMEGRRIEHRKTLKQIMHGVEDNDPFRIVREQDEKQVLQIDLVEGKMIFFKGTIVYTTDLSKQIHERPIYFGSLTFVNNLVPLAFFQLTNTSNKMQIIAVTHLNQFGPLLILDPDIYGESFFINYENIVAATTPVHFKPVCLQLPKFKLFEMGPAKEPIQIDRLYKCQKIALQSNGPIIEKYLAPGEKFVLYDQDNLVAFSRTLLIAKVHNGFSFLWWSQPVELRIEGRGWIFFSSQLGPFRRQSRSHGMTILFLLSILLGIVLGFLLVL